MTRPAAPNRKEFEAMYEDRHTPELHALLKRGRVAIAGLGGLGSHVALALARSGVGRLKLIDFDRVELSNLGRQAYWVRNIGELKTEALRRILLEANPHIEIETAVLRLDAANIPGALAGWSVVIEALDRPEAKACLVETVLAELPSARVVSASGLAGIGGADAIRSRKIGDRLFLCGDGRTGAEAGRGLMAPRVMVCAGHQANLALRLLAGLE